MKGSRSEELVGLLKSGGGGEGVHTGEEGVECFLPNGARGRWSQGAVITIGFTSVQNNLIRHGCFYSVAKWFTRG